MSFNRIDEVQFQEIVNAVKVTPFTFKKNLQHYTSVLDNAQFYKLCLTLVESSSLSFMYIPFPHLGFLSLPQYKELCLLASKNNYLAIRFKPHEVPFNAADYKEICISAISSDPRAIAYISRPGVGPLNSADYADLCITAVSKDELTLEGVLKPGETFLKPEDYKKICLKAIEKNSSALQYVLKPPVGPLSTNDYKDICMRAVSIDAFALQYVMSPGENCLKPEDYKIICLKAIETNNSAFEYVLKPGIGPLSSADYKDICIEAIRINPRQLQNVLTEDETFFTSKDYKHICFEAIKKDINAFQYILKPGMGPLTPNDYQMLKYYVDLVEERITLNAIPKPTEGVLTIEEYKLFCSVAVEKDYTALSLLPKIHENIFSLDEYKTLYFKAAKNDYHALEFIPKPGEGIFTQDEYKDVCIIALRNNYQALKYIPSPQMGFLTEEIYAELCYLAVESNSLALSYIDDENLKISIIERLTPQKIFSNNYASAIYLEELLPESETVIGDFLSSLKNIVVTSGITPEITDSYLVYSTHPKRLDKTIRVDTYDLPELLGKLDNVKSNNNEISLILLGDASSMSESLAGLDIPEIIELIEKHPAITRIVLLGCNTAQAEKLASEKAMIQRDEGQNSNQRMGPDAPCGFAIISGELTENVIDQLKKSMHLNNMYVLSKSINNNNNNNNNSEVYLLTLINSGQTHSWLLSSEQVSTLEKIVNKGKRFNPILPFVTFRTDAHPLSASEQEKIYAVTHNLEAKFEKTHPDYKNHKAFYPSIGNVTIEADEIHKLQDSLLKKLVIAIKNNPNIMRLITVKGFTHMVHVRTAKDKRGFIVSATPLFSGPYSQSMFKTGDNINTEKLKKVRNKEIRDRQNKKIEGETNAKSITVQVKPE